MNDDRVSEKEKQEAEALARALEGDATAGGVPSDALEVAGMLRVSAEDAGLSDARLDQILKTTLAGAEPAKKHAHLWRWLVPAGGLAAAAAAALIVLTLGAAGPTPLPRPSRELLAAQAALATGRPAAIAELKDEMQKYRRQMYKSLAERYKG